MVQEKLWKHIRHFKTTLVTINPKKKINLNGLSNFKTTLVTINQEKVNLELENQHHFKTTLVTINQMLI